MRCKHLAGLIAFVLVLTMGVVALYPEIPLSLRLECAPGADLTADPSTYTWTDITRDLSMSVPITHTRGSQDEQSESNSESSFGLRNNSGRYTIGNPMSDLSPGLDLNTPFRFSTNAGDGSGWNVEWIQYLSEAVDDWPSGTPHLCRAMITCAGPFRRFGQGETIASAMRRASLKIPGSGIVPFAYWSMEAEDATSGTFPWDLSGSGPPMLNFVPTAELTQDDTLRGSLALPVYRFSPFSGNPYTTIPDYTDTGKWVIQAAARVTDYSQVIWAQTPGDTRVASATLNISGGLLVVEASDSGGGYYTSSGALDTTAATTDWVSVTLMSEANSSGALDRVTATVRDSAGLLLATATTLTGAATHQKPTLLNIHNVHFGDAAAGHVAMYTDPAFTIGVDDVPHARAMHGWEGEQTHERLLRLCGEESVPFSTTATTSTLMGPQLIDTFLANLRDGERTDHGQLDDSQGVVGFRALSEFYNQTAALTVNAAQPNRLFLPFSPVIDDQKRRNKVTAAQPSGPSSTVANTADIARVGTYDGTITVNTQSVGQLPFHAAWIANNVGVAPGKRYPGIVLDFLRAPDLLADFRNMRLSDRITITNPPRQHTRSDVDLILPGWSTVIEGRGRVYQLAANCAPYSPYQVGLAGDSTHPAAWCQTGPATQLASELAVGATALSVTIDGPLFTTVADLTAHPMSVVFGGEICPVTSISGVSPQTINVVRTLPKAHAAATIVQVYRPLIAAL